LISAAKEVGLSLSYTSFIRSSISCFRNQKRKIYAQNEGSNESFKVRMEENNHKKLVLIGEFYPFGKEKLVKFELVLLYSTLLVQAVSERCYDK